MENKFNALSLKNIDYRDSDKIVTLLTLERGKFAVCARGVRSAKAKLRYAVSPLCFGTYIIAERNGKGIITACDAIDTFSAVMDDLEKYYVASIILECADKFSEEGNPDSEFFFFIINALKELAYGEYEAKLYGLNFLINLVKKLGYAINYQANIKPDCFDYDLGKIVLKNHSNRYYEMLTEEEVNVVIAILKGENVITINATLVKKSYSILAKYIAYKTNKTLKSTEEIRKII